MKAKKRVILLIALCLTLLGIAYYFPVQRYMARRKLDAYMQLQGIRQSEIESMDYVKDYTQDGYFVDVRFKDDPYRYTYHYYLISRTHRDGVLLDTMTCSVYDADNRGLDSYAEGMRYTPLEWNNR